MKHAVIILSFFAMMGAILSCTPPAGETPYSASVTSVLPGSLASYSGTGSLPGDADDNGILDNVLAGITGTVPVLSGIMSDSNLPSSGAGKALIALVNQFAPKSQSRTVTGTLDKTPPDFSGNLTLTNEVIGSIGVVDSLYAQFSAHVDQPTSQTYPMTISANGSGNLDAAISINAFTGTHKSGNTYTVENGKINASAKAKASGSVTVGQTGPTSFSADYNIGAALSAGFSVSSNTAFVGKYIVEFSYSEKKTITGTGTSLSDPTSLLGDIQFSLTVKIYDNANTLVRTKTYSKGQIINYVNPPTP